MLDTRQPESPSHAQEETDEQLFYVEDFSNELITKFNNQYLTPYFKEVL
jgi:hypothetical protein